MSDRPFNETARNLQLDEFVNEDDPCILRGELQNDDGEWIPAEINLNEVFSAYDSSARLEWGGKDFSLIAVQVILNLRVIPIDGKLEERPMLDVILEDEQQGEVEACVDLSEGIINNNGQFEYQLDRVSEREVRA
ncbi:hypothetical protein ANOM_008318, partial [Aspergillus nomiae NRRL 13137]